MATELKTDKPRRKTLCLDFDGVIHSYMRPWTTAEDVRDPPVTGAINFIALALEHFDVAIYSSRSHQPGGINAMVNWLKDWAIVEHGAAIDRGEPITDIVEAHRFDWIDRIQWPQHKPSAHVTIDDRAITFAGAWPPMALLIDFVPWNKTKFDDRIVPLVDTARYLDLERRYYETIELLLMARTREDERTKEAGDDPGSWPGWADHAIKKALARHPIKIENDRLKVINAS